MTDLGDRNIGEFRERVLRLYLLIAAPSAVMISFVYYYLEIHAMTVANAIYSAVTVLLCIGFLTGRVSFRFAAPIFVAATIASMMMGLYAGSESVDNRCWQLLVPLAIFTLFGANAGRIWVAVVLVIAVGVMHLGSIAYAPVSTAVFASAYSVMALATYAFCRFNEINIRTIAKLSHTDSLTGLYNRQFFEELSSNVFNRSLRTRESIAVYMIDIDWFKRYNDHYGHVLGDQAQAHVAGVIRTCARRGTDLVFRYGGEEFCVISSGIQLNDAKALGNNILDGVRQLEIPHAESDYGTLTVSVGLSHHELLEGETPQNLLRYADAALYAAKSSGRNALHTNVGVRETDAAGAHQPA